MSDAEYVAEVDFVLGVVTQAILDDEAAGDSQPYDPGLSFRRFKAFLLCVQEAETEMGKRWADIPKAHGKSDWGLDFSLIELLKPAGHEPIRIFEPLQRRR